MVEPRGGAMIKGTLDLLILEILSQGELHGWGITERIEQQSDALLSVNQGSLYPALYRLLGRRWIRSEWRVTENNRRARYYVLTPRGAKQLAQEREQWARLSRGVNLILERA